MYTINKEILIKICILLLILILLRFLYIRLNTNSLQTISKHNNNNNTNIENFDVNNGDAIDLLSKIKNNDIKPLNVDTQIANTFIKPWTTKIYNMQSGNNQIKPIALYQPQLTVNNNQYCKLGDMLCQNNDYSPPDSAHFTVLIKKGSSDIKPPAKYDLIVNFGEENVNSNYYIYESFITTHASQTEIYAILPNIINCSQIFTNINNLINKNPDKLQTGLLDVIQKDLKIKANNKDYDITSLMKNKTPINISITDNTYSFPAGMSGTFISNEYIIDKGFTDANPIPIPFTIPLSLDSLQTDDANKIASYAQNAPFIKIDATNIIIKTYATSFMDIFPISGIIKLIENLCNDISAIYDKHISNPGFLKYLNLINDSANTQLILNSITDFNTFVSQYDNPESVTLKSNPEIKTYVDLIFATDCGTSIVGQAFSIIQNSPIKYKLTFLSFTAANIEYPVIPIPTTTAPVKKNFTDIPRSTTSSKPSGKSSNVVEGFDPVSKFVTEDVPGGFGTAGKAIYDGAIIPARNGFIVAGNGIKYGGNTVGCYLSGGTATQACKDGASGSAYGGGGKDDDKTPIKVQFINMLKLTSFTNNFVNNIPKNSLNINLNEAYGSSIKSSIKNLTDFTLFLNALQNNTIKNLPLKIYKPIAPKGYVSLGHIFCNLQNQLADIKTNDAASNGVCCVPENCVKEMREWNISDKMFEYNKNGMYWALYYNPFTGTFISTNKNRLPDGKVSKVIACVKKCTAVAELEKADDCIRNYYNMNKQYSISLAPDLFSNSEEEYYLDKVKSQSDTITQLFKKANSMQLEFDKANIVNAEMNKNKLQTYVDTQKRNIDIVTQRLVEDANKIQTNINIPLDVLNALLNMIKNNKTLTSQEKSELTNKLLDNKKLADANLITKDEYDKNLHKIMSNCPDYDLSGLVKKEVVSSVCYGCPT